MPKLNDAKFDYVICPLPPKNHKLNKCVCSFATLNEELPLIFNVKKYIMGKRLTHKGHGTALEQITLIQVYTNENH